VFDLCRKLTSLEEQNRELISVNAKRDEALQQAKVMFSFLFVCVSFRYWLEIIEFL